MPVAGVLRGAGPCGGVARQCARAGRPVTRCCVVPARSGSGPPAAVMSGSNTRRQQHATTGVLGSRQQACRGRCLIARGSSKASLYSKLPAQLEEPTPGFDSIASALEDLAAGKFVVVLDDEDRENEGDLIINADKVTTEAMAFMVEHTSGVICISMEGAALDRLQLPLMVSSAENEEQMYTAFTVTVDLRHGTTTGISAADRAATLRALADPGATAADFRRPGHIFPLRYRPGGVIARPGHTEAAVDLARLSGSAPAGVLCEIVDRRDGSMARTPQLLAFAAAHGLRCVTIADLIRYRLRHEQLLTRVAATPLQTRYGAFTAVCYRSRVDGSEHAALVAGSLPGLAQQPAQAAPAAPQQQQPQQQQPQQQAQQPGVLARVQLQRRLIDVFGSLHCGQGPFLDSALQRIAAAGQGVLLYVAGRDSNSLADELRDFAVAQEACSIAGAPSDSSSSSSSGGGGGGGAAAGGGSNRGGPSSSLSSDLRDAAAAAHMLRDLGVTRVALMSEDDGEAQRLRCCGVEATLVGLPADSNDSSGGGGAGDSGSSLLQQQQLHALLQQLGGHGGSGSGTPASNGAVVGL